LAGKGAAEAVDPTAEDAYWRENYRARDYVDRSAAYETYQPAYRAGYEGFGRYPGRRYDEVEADLRRDYEQTAGRTALGWEKARHAARDAWTRVENVRAQRQTPASGTSGSSSPEGNSNALGSSAAAATAKQGMNSGEPGTGCGCGDS